MFLSVIDLTPFKDKNGTTHKASRKLMAVKQSQQKKFDRLMHRKGTLRGALFETSRDGPKDAAIGNDMELLKWVKEKKLENDFIRTWEDREGKKHVENMGEPFDYSEIFEAPDADKIRAMLGVEPPIGSAKQQDRDMGKSDDGWDDDDDDDEPWDKDDDDKDSGDKRGKKKRKKDSDKKSSSKRKRRGRKDKASDSEGTERAGEDDADKPKSGRGSRRTRRSR